jgi:HD superfamily phosphohydrolase
VEQLIKELENGITSKSDSFWLTEHQDNRMDGSELKVVVSRSRKQKWTACFNEASMEDSGRPPWSQILIIKRESGDKLSGGLLQTKILSSLEKQKQLGVKDYLLGKSKQRPEHTRYEHSRGTLIIGVIYLGALAPFSSVTRYKHLRTEETRWITSAALALHDAGHLPFGHLMEEIFTELNWSNVSQSATHRHDESPLDYIEDNMKTEFMDILRKLIPSKKPENSFEIVSDLIAGVSGIPFLDAIVNSALDADKIDYIYRDMQCTGMSSRLRSSADWLRDFLSNISLTPEGLIRLNGDSSLCTLELLKERQFLYENLYLRADIRAFEKIASTVIKSWLLSSISKKLQIPHSVSPDLRSLKAETAHKLLMTVFEEADEELDFLIRLCDDLQVYNQDLRDSESIHWFGKIQERLKEFKNVNDDSILRSQFNDIAVCEPYWIPRDKSERAKEIARQLYVDFPCSALIDIVDYPSFIPSSRSRQVTVGYRQPLESETFLVPHENIAKWRRDSIGRVPLSYCDFKSVENRRSRVTIIDPLPQGGKGSYVFELFRKRCSNAGIEPVEEYNMD